MEQEGCKQGGYRVTDYAVAAKPKPSKSQLKPKLRYYPVTLFRMVKAVLGRFQSAEIQALFVLLRLQI
ncbi:hypothetical protein [Coprobacter sp.]|uniref:hypothetical protein n=1 Tax=Coprobacter sp. TaxID=1941478 RepID=UPI003AB1407D